MSFNPSGGGRLSGANDIALNNPSEGEVLTYNANIQKWQNAPHVIPQSSSSYSSNATTSRPLYPAPTQNPYTVVFQDNFQLPQGQQTSSIDINKWGFEQGTGAAFNNAGWGNNELQSYTTSRNNAEVTTNGLEIRLINQAVSGYDGSSNWSSAKLLTKGKFVFTYGKVDAVIKIPYGKGAWPAFWMLGDSFSQAGWPGCGELDIMETGLGGNFYKTLGTLHGPGYSGGLCVSRNYTNNTLLSDAFHKFSIEWTPGQVDWLLDDVVYATITRNQVPQPHNWVFDAPQYLILNVAVANGGFPGPLDTSTFQTGTYSGQSVAHAIMTVQSVTVSQRL